MTRRVRWGKSVEADRAGSLRLSPDRSWLIGCLVELQDVSVIRRSRLTWKTLEA
jgi:hypothetical protein